MQGHSFHVTFSPLCISCCSPLSTTSQNKDDIKKKKMNAYSHLCVHLVQQLKRTSWTDTGPHVWVCMTLRGTHYYTTHLWPGAMRHCMHLNSGTAPKKRSCARLAHHDCWWSFFFFLQHGTCPVPPPPSTRPRRFPASPASSAAGCGCERKTWSPSSPAGCSPAGGRVRGSARSRPSPALAAPWGSSSGWSPRLRARPLTRGA